MERIEHEQIVPNHAVAQLTIHALTGAHSGSLHEQIDTEGSKRANMVLKIALVATLLNNGQFSWKLTYLVFNSSIRSVHSSYTPRPDSFPGSPQALLLGNAA